MTQLTRDEVLKLARLARLELSDAEVEAYRIQLSDILAYVQQLQEADVDGLEPTTQVNGLKNVTRKDVIVNYGVAPADLLKRTPHSQEGQIKVKRMIS